jgi:streptogramin lyase
VTVVGLASAQDAHAQGLAAASAQEPTAREEQPIAEPEIEAYAQDHGVGTDIASEALAVQRRGAGIVEALQAVQKGAYAGVWFDTATGEFVIPVPRGAKFAPAVGLARSLGVRENTRIVEVDSTWDELAQAHEAIDKELSDLISKGRAQTWLDPSANAVVIAVPVGANDSATAIANEAANEALVKVEVRRVEKIERFESTPYACWVNEASCDRPARGGVFIEPSGVLAGQATCTAGFKAVGNQFSNRFMLTAGHCYAQSADWRAWDSTGAYHYLGNISAGAFPGEDYAAIRVNGFGKWWEEGPEGTNWKSVVVYWGGNQNLPINYEGSSYLGQSVCMSGWTSKSSCGTVSRVDFTNTYDDGSTVHHLTEASGVLANHGDSGGPIWAGETALGLVSGGPADPSRVYYTEVTRATEAMGVTVGQKMGAPPYAETGEPVTIGGRQATVAGKVDPNGVATSYAVQYGTQNGVYPYSTPAIGAGSSFQTLNVSPSILNLQPLTQYHYRLVAWNSWGTSYGTEHHVKTGAGEPLISFPAGPTRGTNSATLAAAIDPGGAATTFQFEWGPTASYGKSTSVGSAGSGVTPTGVSAPVTGLTPETTYHFRVKATNSVGTVYSGDQSFTALAKPASYSSSYTNPLLDKPSTMDADDDGNVWVVDRYRSKLLKLDAKGSVAQEFGVVGTAPGQIKEPRGIATSPDGTIWVTETGSSRLQQFSASGQFIREIRPTTLGSGGGEAWIREPSEIAVPGNGRIYVADQNRQAILAFNEQPNVYGEYIDSIIGGPSTTPNPTGLDANLEQGFLAVLDWQVHKVQVFDLTTRQLLASVGGAEGSGPGQLKNPYGLAVKANGAILVSDRGNNRVQVFSRWGEYLGDFGSLGSGAGQMSEPSGIAASSRGVIFVSDKNNKRIQRWTQQGGPEAVALKASLVTTSGVTLRGHVNPSGAATTYSFEYGPTTAYGTTVPAGGASAGSGYESIIATQPITGLTAGDGYYVRVKAANSEGTTYSAPVRVWAAPTWKFASAFGSLGSSSAQFNRPLGAVADASGYVWVVDKFNHRVKRYTPTGVLDKSIGTFGSSQGQVNEPLSVAIDAQGDIWLAEDGNDRIQEFSPSGTFLSSIGPIDSSQVRLQTPSGLAFDADGYLYVGDQSKDNVQKYDPKAPQGQRFVTSWGPIDGPTQMATDPQGDVWFVDNTSGAVTRWERSGPAMPKTEFTLGAAAYPYGIAFTPDGQLLISERGNNQVEMFTRSGKRLNSSLGGGPGSLPGQFKEVGGLALAGDGSLFTADSGNNRVQRWEVE